VPSKAGVSRGSVVRLEDFRRDGTEKKSPSPSPIVRTLRDQRVLAFDQSVANTGWALVAVVGGVPRVLRTGMVVTEPSGEAQMLDMLRRAMITYANVRSVILANEPQLIVHEIPLGGRGASLKGASSSLLASLAVRIAASEEHIETEMVSGNRVKAHITGSGKASKSEVAAAVRARLPGLKEQKPGPLNEHVYDAIGIALTHLEQP